MFDLTIVCKVVDNFGDIGFVYRLSKNLIKINPSYNIRLIVDDLESFKKIAPSIDSSKAEQELLVSCAADTGNEDKPITAGRLRVFDAKAAAICAREWTQNPPRVILECFQCGRPDWLDDILFDKKPDDSADEKNALKAFIINIDYLTAEDYAEEFHCLKSGTRSANIRKVNFMPGFTNKTGGLILDIPHVENNASGIAGKTKSSEPQVLMFSYPKDFVPIIRAITRWNKNAKINLAQGAGKESFLKSAREVYGKTETAEAEIVGKTETASEIKNLCKTKKAAGPKIFELPFLSQEEWDKNLYAQDILFVRGEDSLSRACLAGKPFVWQAYLQEDDYQLVKVRALLKRMKPYFAEEDFLAIEKFWLLYNGAEIAGLDKNCLQGQEARGVMEAACYDFLQLSQKTRVGFEAFSKSLIELGNFSEHLDKYIQGIQGL
ncbi:MAG: elongation factor P maturation arginine rhamnosyltransferase EarP [Treponema sp.]|nr:elongation factor P maturation arginine rhamnosyltransferase EarP [Treponema sp.]